MIMLSPPDVGTSTSLVLSGSGVSSPDAGVGTPATVAAREGPSLGGGPNRSP